MTHHLPPVPEDMVQDDKHEVGQSVEHPEGEQREGVDDAIKQIIDDFFHSSVYMPANLQTFSVGKPIFVIFLPQLRQKKRLYGFLTKKSTTFAVSK